MSTPSLVRLFGRYLDLVENIRRVVPDYGTTVLYARSCGGLQHLDLSPEALGRTLDAIVPRCEMQLTQFVDAVIQSNLTAYICYHAHEACGDYSRRRYDDRGYYDNYPVGRRIKPLVQLQNDVAPGGAITALPTVGLAERLRTVSPETARVMRELLQYRQVEDRQKIDVVVDRLKTLSLLLQGDAARVNSPTSNVDSTIIAFLKWIGEMAASMVGVPQLSYRDIHLPLARATYYMTVLADGLSPTWYLEAPTSVPQRSPYVSCAVSDVTLAAMAEVNHDMLMALQCAPGSGVPCMSAAGMQFVEEQRSLYPTNFL